ncbi:flagellar biosynthetic protein FliO [Klenkia sp. PcliD-1-E]|uniref:FliO/MopB family protein n=1 Tax=Klenkia sp. PcliD-1-E TaxID=2954492 RepID=UPI0020970EFA|nr:flagellar biosynthetic protein FliO [Klenkia sp. PcliD-1-E]MCO7221732.1 flagellar biosynthetic protein FliO [Klenkia sp. PcliD-1-E]
MTWMIIRLVLSLAFVAGVLWFAARVAKKRGLGMGNGLIEVVARQRMGRSSTVSVLRVADRVLVVGSTEEHVTLLAEMDAEIVDEVLAEAEEERATEQEARRAAVAARRPARALEAGDELLDDAPTSQIPLPALPGVPGARRPRRPAPVARHGGGLVAGSVFDRAAWTQVVEGLRERTVRR